MKFYLSSSYKFGTEALRLIEMTANGNRHVALIPNALDYATDLERRITSVALTISDLEGLGFTVEIIDLKQYFNDPIVLEEQLEHYDVIWVRGGNAFVLAQAMKLCGFDEIIKKYYRDRKNIVYGGYSAGVCILGPTLRGIHLVDDPHQKPYGEQHEAIWEGLHILNFAIAPHYKSDHKESEAMDKAVEYMIDNKILFKALRDGEVIIIE
ncbi:Type 1 glutamine amidotransferase-like domain-containing protein [Paenibacillus guangzhouensis]|uniref:Type 1 glutamine amidotransferase-like domain-containing protein n=1 Tax=Paenibacillus guangzhouensis TaxID=1473112 RepID=UPI0012669879|nr:Type 1 glutamine amidotransferase-like domain-containing protein [Paenibacillus guangzhouensis]